MTRHAVMDLQHVPVSFDAVHWLVHARCVVGDGPLHVVIAPKEDGVGGFARDWGKHDEAEARWRLWHIVIPACQMVGATVTLAGTREEAARIAGQSAWWPEGKSHLVRHVVDAVRSGAAVPMLKPSEAARRHVGEWLARFERPVVTLTLRRKANDPGRNSDPATWKRFAAWLRDAGYDVVFLADTVEALAAGRGYAELDIDLRLALYEAAHCNVIGANGPIALLFHSGAPFIRVAMGQPERQWRKHLREHTGLAWGEKLPWLRTDQRMCYRPDTYGVLVEEFTAWRS